MGSCIGTFDRYQNKWPWMTLNSWYALLQKRCVLWHLREKFEWRQTHSISRSVILLSRNTRYMRIFAWVPEGSASNDNGVVDNDIFGCFGGYFVGNFREKPRIVCNLHSIDKDQQKMPCCGRETARCRCKIRYVSKFTAASRGSPCNSTAFLLSFLLVLAPEWF